MELDKDSDNQIIAVETFTPDLIGEYAECYNALVKKLTGVLAANRVTVIKKEISDMKKNEESVEGLKYMAVLSVLITEYHFENVRCRSSKRRFPHQGIYFQERRDLPDYHRKL